MCDAILCDPYGYLDAIKSNAVRAPIACFYESGHGILSMVLTEMQPDIDGIEGYEILE